jgi:baculoviral IAP repeat-containing protein 1
MSSSSDTNGATSCCTIFNCTKKDLIRSGFYRTKLFDSIVCCGCGWELFNAKLPLKHINFIHKVQNPNCKMSNNIQLDINEFVKYISYVKEIKKMMRDTYINWPRQKPSVDDLVESGFYYTGESDATTCMSCGVTLDEWEDSDDPNVEHEKANPNCELFNM